MLTAPLTSAHAEPAPSPSPANDCWLLHLSSGHAIAISIHQVTELLKEATRLPVPRTPDHCRHLIAWRERLIPLVDYRPHQDSAQGQVMVIRFQNAAQGIDYLGFSVKHIEKISLSDDDFRAPDNLQALPFANSLLSSCWVNNQPIYILDMHSLYYQP